MIGRQLSHIRLQLFDLTLKCLSSYRREHSISRCSMLFNTARSKLLVSSLWFQSYHVIMLIMFKEHFGMDKIWVLCKNQSLLSDKLMNKDSTIYTKFSHRLRRPLPTTYDARFEYGSGKRRGSPTHSCQIQQTKKTCYFLKKRRIERRSQAESERERMDSTHVISHPSRGRRDERLFSTSAINSFGPCQRLRRIVSV